MILLPFFNEFDYRMWSALQFPIHLSCIESTRLSRDENEILCLSNYVMENKIRSQSIIVLASQDLESSSMQ